MTAEKTAHHMQTEPTVERFTGEIIQVLHRYPPGHIGSMRTFAQRDNTPSKLEKALPDDEAAVLLERGVLDRYVVIVCSHISFRKRKN